MASFEIMVLALLAVAAAVGWLWWLKAGRAPEPERPAPPVTGWADFVDTSPLDGAAPRSRTREAVAPASEPIPPAPSPVWKDSVREDPIEETSPVPFLITPLPPPPALPPRPSSALPGGTVSAPVPLTPAVDSWFMDVDLDEPASPTEQAAMRAQDRMQRAAQMLEDGPVDRAWEALRGFIPAPGVRAATLETCDRIAAGFEAQGRPESARDVYEYMADLDPDWPDVRQRLMRARGLAQMAVASSFGSVPPRPVPTLSESTLGRYMIDKLLGKGAMGAVYLGHDPANGRTVALKTMSLAREFSGAELADARARFLREADMAGRLQHPDIVSIVDAGEADGLAFIAMEVVDGAPLNQYTQAGRLLPVPVVLRIVARVADALAYAHSRGVTHRDIKPDNIMVDVANDGVKVMDFGVARVADASRTRTGVVLGTPTYMSPEQLSGQPIDGRSDLYSLGVTLFQLLTGQLPYQADSLGALMRSIGQTTPPHVCTLCPELPQALGDVVALALQKHPATRYANGEQMAEDLRTVARALQSPARPWSDDTDSA